MRERSSLLHNFVLQDNVNDSWRWLLFTIAFLLCLIVWWIGILLTMFGTNLFPPRCLFLCGASFVIDYILKATCCEGA